MAYLAQNQEDEKNQSSQVLNPNSQVQQLPQQSGSQAPSGQGAYIEASQGNGQMPTPAAPAPKKASSGQFTNLKSYISANQGAGQKIGQQITGSMEKSAQKIGSAIGQQKLQYQAQIGQQEAQRSQAGQQAQQLLQRIQGPPQQPVQQPNAQEAPKTEPAPAYSKYINNAEMDYIRNKVGVDYKRFQEDLDTTFKPRVENTGLNGATWQAPTPDASQNLKSITPEQQALNDLYNKQQEEIKIADLYKKYNIDTSEMAKQLYSVSPEEQAKFRELATGQRTFEDVQNMNLTPQEIAQQQLAAKAESLRSFEGRGGQLKEIFGKQRQYGTGQQNIDNLLLQSQGLGQVLDRSKQISQDTGGQLIGAKQYSREELARLIGENKAFAQGLQKQTDVGQEGILSELDKLHQITSDQRAEELKSTFNPFMEAETQELADLEKYYGAEAVRQRLVDSSRERLGEGGFRATNEAEMRFATENQARNNLMSFEDFKALNPPRNIEQATNLQQRYQNYTAEKLKQASNAGRLQGRDQVNVDKFLEDYVKTGTNTPRLARNLEGKDWDWRVKDIMENALTGKGSAVDADTLRNLGMSQKDIEDVYNRVGGQYIDTAGTNTLIDRFGKGIQSQKEALPTNLSNALQQATGYGYEDYTRGKDLSRESLVSDANRARYNALAALAGNQNLALQYQRPGDAVAAKNLSQGQMKELLAKIAATHGRATTSTVPSGGVSSMGNPKANIG